MNLKKEIRLQTIIVSLIVSFITIVLLSIIANNNYTQNSLGIQLLEINQLHTQTANSVTSVVTYFRGLDTLGEVTILFLAIFGVVLGLEKNTNTTNILAKDSFLLQTGAKVIVPIIILFGLYIITQGHLSPGGGFQGGVIIASGFLLNFLAFGDKYSLDHKPLALFESLSGSGIIVLGVVSFITVGLFLGNFLPLGELGTLLSGGVIPILYIFVGLKVASEIIVLIEYFLNTEKKTEEKKEASDV